MRLAGYYAILDVRPGDPPDGSGGIAAAASEALMRRAQERLAIRPCCLQLRGKNVRAADLVALARALLPQCRAADVLFCVNDRLDVALAVGADAVHLGQDDLPLGEARRIAAGRLMIGVSTHDVGQAVAAARGGADYIGYGPVFGTASKANPDPVVGLAGLRSVVTEVAIPVVAIGGIEPANVAEVAGAGAAAAAVIAGVDAAADPAAAARAIAGAFR